MVFSLGKLTISQVPSFLGASISSLTATSNLGYLVLPELILGTERVEIFYRNILCFLEIV